MRRIAITGALFAAIPTLAVGIHSLFNRHLLSVLEYLLYPGAMVAFGLHGDNYRSEQQFRIATIILGVPINALAGALTFMLVIWLKRAYAIQNHSQTTQTSRDS